MASDKEFHLIYYHWFGIHYIWLTHKPGSTNSSVVSWNLIKFGEKGSVKKRKTSINRSRVFEIALEGEREWKNGGNGNFGWESFDYSMLLSY